MEHRITELQKSQKILHDKIMHLKSNQTVALHTPIIRHISKRNCYIKTTRPIATYDVVLDNMFHFRNELNPVSTFQMAAYIFSDPADASSISTALTKSHISMTYVFLQILQETYSDFLRCPSLPLKSS